MNIELIKNAATISYQDRNTGLFMLVLAILVFIFRKSQVRAFNYYQKDILGFHMREKDGIWAIILWCAMIFIWGAMLVLAYAIGISFPEKAQEILIVVLFGLGALLTILYMVKERYALWYVDGEPAVWHVGNRKIYLHYLIPIALLPGLVLLMGSLVTYILTTGL